MNSQTIIDYIGGNSNLYLSDIFDYFVDDDRQENASAYRTLAILLISLDLNHLNTKHIISLLYKASKYGDANALTYLFSIPDYLENRELVTQEEINIILDIAQNKSPKGDPDFALAYGLYLKKKSDIYKNMQVSPVPYSTNASESPEFLRKEAYAFLESAASSQKPEAHFAIYEMLESDNLSWPIEQNDDLRQKAQFHLQASYDLAYAPAIYITAMDAILNAKCQEDYDDGIADLKFCTKKGLGQAALTLGNLCCGFVKHPISKFRLNDNESAYLWLKVALDLGVAKAIDSLFKLIVKDPPFYVDISIFSDYQTKYDEYCKNNYDEDETDYLSEFMKDQPCTNLQYFGLKSLKEEDERTTETFIKNCYDVVRCEEFISDFCNDVNQDKK